MNAATCNLRHLRTMPCGNLCKGFQSLARGSVQVSFGAGVGAVQTQARSRLRTPRGPGPVPLAFDPFNFASPPDFPIRPGAFSALCPAPAWPGRRWHGRGATQSGCSAASPRAQDPDRIIARRRSLSGEGLQAQWPPARRRAGSCGRGLSPLSQAPFQVPTKATADPGRAFAQ